MRASSFGLVAVGVLLLGPARAEARCAAGYVVALPAAGPLPANGQIVLEGNGVSKTWVEHLEAASLVAPGHRVALTVREHLRAGGAEQVVLTTSAPLRVGQTYALQAPRMGTNESVSLLDAKWTAVSADDAAPIWKSAPAVSGLDQVQLGCGPDTHLKVGVSVDESGPLLIRTTVEGGGSFFVEAKVGSAALGHSMCGGPWTPEPDRRYVLKLSAVDGAGHETPAPGAALVVETAGGDAGTHLALAPSASVVAPVPVPSAEPTTTTSSGCGVAPRAGASWWAVVGMALLTIRRRGRRATL